jgi:hypothetical protein
MSDTPPVKVKNGSYDYAEMQAAIEHAMQGKCDCTYKFYQAHEYADGAVQASGTITISPEQYAAWLAGDECAKWRVTTVAGLQAELAKARARIRTLETKNKQPEAVA